MRFSVVSTTLLLSALTSVQARMEKRSCTAKNQPSSLSDSGSGSTGNSGSSGNSSSGSSSSSKHHHSATGTATVPSATGTSTSTSFSSEASDSGNSSSPSSSSTFGQNSNSPYKLVDHFAGDSFFSGFDFYTDSDPTHGNVNYVSQDDATSKGLAYVDGDRVVMKVDNTTQLSSGGNRDSIRITSQNSYTSGLVILDVAYMPYGCGVWPAFWTVGGNWPNGGEVDIVEGVNLNSNNQATLHTSSGCTLDSSLASGSSNSKRRRSMRSKFRHAMAARANKKRDGSATLPSGLDFTGNVVGTDCDANANGNAGCGVTNPSSASYGQGANAAGGGVFATILDETGIATWFFSRDQIPDDINSGSPNPQNWGAPYALWSSATCPTSQYFGAQSIVINITLCGDWAGAVYPGDGQCPGSCADAVADPSNFDTAQWHINSVQVWQ